VVVFGWGRSKDQSQPIEAFDAVGEPVDVAAILRAVDAVVPRYLGKVDQGRLIYPACKRKLNDSEGDPRSVWEHTRLEAVRYMTMVPARQAELLLEPARQLELIDTFLRRQPHEKIVVDFTGVPADDVVIAIIAGLNWLNHCSVLVGVDRGRYSGTLRNFRKVAMLAQQWWMIDGAQERCVQMLQTRQKPPMMFHLIWQDYTRLAKEIACAAMFGPSLEKTVARRREKLKQELSGNPSELMAALAELDDTMARFAAAQEPDNLLENGSSWS
jgi:hypothetical protein